MEQKILEEINRIKFISNYNTKTTNKEQIDNSINEQDLKRFLKNYSPIRFQRGDWDIEGKRGRTFVNRPVGKQGSQDERYYEDGKVYTGSADEEGIEFGTDEKWKIGTKGMSPETAANKTKGETFQNCSTGMQKAMDKDSKNRWISLIEEFQANPNEKPLLGKALFDAVNLYARKYIETDCLTPKKKLKIAVGDESHVEEIEKQVQLDPEKPEDIEVTLTFPVKNNPNSEFFTNNSSELKPLFISEVGELITTIKNQMSQMQDPQVYLSYLNVKTSCSRLRNQKLAKDKTWLQLSEDRTKAARNYILTKLDEIGVKRDAQDGVALLTTYTVDSKGLNGDGSSGPNATEPFYYNTDGLGTWYCGDNTEKGKACKGQRDAFGTPKAETELESFKYLVSELGLVFKGQKIDPKEAEPKFSSTTENVPIEMYNVRFIIPGKNRRFRLWIPQLVISIPRMRGFFAKLFSGKAAKHKRKIDCFFEKET